MDLGIAYYYEQLTLRASLKIPNFLTSYDVINIEIVAKAKNAKK